MEKYTMVKTEVQSNGDIFLYYVDENGSPIETEDGVITTIDQSQLQELQENYVLEEIETENEVVETIENESSSETILPDEAEVYQEEPSSKERWLEEETKKMLIFYLDNKEAFQNGSTTKKHLWSVACKMMLIGKNYASCEMKLRNMKRKYALLRIEEIKRKSDPKLWPFYQMCHQAFHDDSYVAMMINESCNRMNTVNQRKQTVNIPMIKPNEDAATTINKMNKTPDEKVKQMLELYLQYKKDSSRNPSWQKHVWKNIAIQLGEDCEYVHKRFLNFKQHYIKMLEKRNDSSAKNIAWPYMHIFDEIYADDTEFTKKYGPIRVPGPRNDTQTPIVPLEWNETEDTILVKYYFDCIDEFQDPSIPNTVLWHEVGRLLDKNWEDCTKRYMKLRKAHLNHYVEGGYNLRTRKPVAIIFDNIISQEVEHKFYDPCMNDSLDQWESEKIDNLVQFLFDNIEMFKDPICHFVCWEVIAMKLGETVLACKQQWNDLTTLYKSILNDKKEDSDMQIDWRYIDIFDRIFDYGMDTKLLEGYENKLRIPKKQNKVVLGKKTKGQTSGDEDLPDNLSDLETEEFDENTSGKRPRGTADATQIRLLEFYMRNKDRFSTTNTKKLALWAMLAEQIGLSAEQCAHRFRNLKQVYIAYIQREIDKPDKPILWPYYALCKKVFGFRPIKNKLKNKKLEMNDSDSKEWSPKEIKKLINYIGQHVKDIEPNVYDMTKWASLAKEIDKTEKACREKFIELRKSYRKIKTMMSHNPLCKVTWKYFKLFEDIYTKESFQPMDVDSTDEQMVVVPSNIIKTEIQDDDFQCIIVLPEGQEISDLNNPQIIIKNEPQVPAKRKAIKRWTPREQITLLNHVYDYIKSHKGNPIKNRDMWQEIAKKFTNRGYISCQRSYVTLKQKYKKLKEEQKNKPGGFKKSRCDKLIQQILKLKPKFIQTPFTDEELVLKEQTTYTDVPLPLWRVEMALKYYLDHVDEFVNPKYVKKYSWIELGKAVELPVRRIFQKINYLKQAFNSETNEINGEKGEFADVIKEIFEKEFICTIAMGDVIDPMSIDGDAESVTWSDEETDQLLQWYLRNLDKFKNPKYVPSYLWLEASSCLHKSPLACSKKMNEVRSQYSAMAKENPDALNNWRFYDLCQKIYGTGKRIIMLKMNDSLPTTERLEE